MKRNKIIIIGLKIFGHWFVFTKQVCKTTAFMIMYKIWYTLFFSSCNLIVQDVILHVLFNVYLINSIVVSNWLLIMLGSIL